jgi:hypothetical protein
MPPVIWVILAISIIDGIALVGGLVALARNR